MFTALFIVIFELIMVVLVESQDNNKRPCGKTQPILFKESEESQRMVEIVFLNNRIKDCYIYGNKLLAENSISNKLCKPKIVFVERRVLSEKALECSKWLLNRMKGGNVPIYSDPNFPSKFNNKIDRNFYDGILIYPGTKWCGAGNSAENFDDLGEERETDLCCRSHDNCPDLIQSGETKYNLTNDNYFSKCHCDCDHQLWRCLKAVNRTTSKRMGQLFFNLLQLQCFKKDYPIVKCLEYKGIAQFWQNCQKYEFDCKQQMIYQFFDAIYFE